VTLYKLTKQYHYFFTARCYAERVTATASRLSISPSITLRYRDDMGWKSSKIISLLVSLGCPLSADPIYRGFMQDISKSCEHIRTNFFL